MIGEKLPQATRAIGILFASRRRRIRWAGSAEAPVGDESIGAKRQGGWRWKGDTG